MLIPLETLQDAEDVMLKTPLTSNLRHWSKLYSSSPHLSGDLAHAQRICDLWNSYGVPSELVRYDVLQNIPVASSLSLQNHNGDVKFQASLTEPELPEDPTSAPSNGYPPFHGFSANGKATAPLVYANFGTLQDFQLLAARGISVKDKIVICKYSKIFRGLKVRAAEKYGAVGVIIYSDPQEDGEMTEKNGHLPYPHGPARHPHAVQRGSVDYFSIAVGDPTTPGYPSLPGDETERKDPKGAIPSIPSLPISYADAFPFLKSLDGFGLSPEEMDSEGDWRGGLDEVGYFTGPGKLQVTLFNEGTYKYQPIYNVIGTLQGKSKDLVVLGNHHDSWTVSAVDPVSGSATMNEMVRAFGKLKEMGWVHERTIILASWDNEEYGLVGSTEWGEENADLLSKHCVAYINVDGSTNGGSILSAAGSPLLTPLLQSAATAVPSSRTPDKTVYDDWQQFSSSPDSPPTLDLLGTGSDYTVFLDHLGIPSINMKFSRSPQQKASAVYHYHSNYDSHHWMCTFGDTTFSSHLAMSQYWGIVGLRLANERIVPFNARSYATALAGHVDDLEIKSKGLLDIEVLKRSVVRFDRVAAWLDVDTEVELALTKATRNDKKLARINEIYKNIERGFLHSKGLAGREWFKHMVFAPGLWLGYGGVVFPGVLEALDAGDVEGANRWVAIIASTMEGIANMMEER